MEIRNATYDRRLDLLDCRMTVLGLDLYAIKNGEIFDDLKCRCIDCIFPELCAADLRRDPNNPVWETYCPNAAMLGDELDEAKWFKQALRRGQYAQCREFTNRSKTAAP